MSNITNLNRDYLIKINVKEATIDVPKMTFWNTDKKTSNMFVQLVINMSENELIKNYATIENATDYKIVLNVIKPKTNQYRTFEAKLLNEEKALFEIDLPDEFTDQVGDYSFEFEVSSKVDSNDESITTSNGTYKVNGSILTNLNEETSSSPDLPILKQLIEQVKSLQGGDLTGYQKKSDNSLETTSKEVVGAINEVNSQFKDIAKEIENITTNGLTNSQLSALDNMFKVCAYTKQDISTEYDAFKTAFGISSGDTPITKQYTITNNLSNCKNSNSNTSIKESTSYVATITPDNGYIINQITVMMDGKDITNTAVDGSTIHITSVTGNIIITVTTTGIEPQPSLLYNWDLTNSLTDTVSNKGARLVGTTSEGTISSDGLTLGVSNAVGIVIDCDIVGKKIEFDLGDCPSRNTTTRAFVFGGTNAETLSSGLLYRNGYWTPYNASGWGDATTYSDSQMFNNSTVTIEVDSNYNAVFKFNNEIITTVILNNSNIQTFGFGSKSQSWVGAIVKAVRVYQM